MILVSFSFAEDALSNDVKNHFWLARYRKSAVPLFLCTPGINMNSLNIKSHDILRPRANEAIERRLKSIVFNLFSINNSLVISSAWNLTAFNYLENALKWDFDTLILEGKSPYSQRGVPPPPPHTHTHTHTHNREKSAQMIVKMNLFSKIFSHSRPWKINELFNPLFYQLPFSFIAVMEGDQGRGGFH